MEDGDPDEAQAETVELFRPFELRVKRRTLPERPTGPECAERTNEQMMQWVDRREGRRTQENGPERELRGHRPGERHEEGGLRGDDHRHDEAHARRDGMTRPDARDEDPDDEDEANDIDQSRRGTAEAEGSFLRRSLLREDAEDAAHDVLGDGERVMALEVLVPLFAQAIA